MTESIGVTCLMDRYWDPVAMNFGGTEVSGALIEICMQSAEDNPGKLILAGVVLLADNTIHSVPLEFIKKTVTQ